MTRATALDEAVALIICAVPRLGARRIADHRGRLYVRRRAELTTEVPYGIVILQG